MGSILFALSRFSTNCSKLSKAISLFSNVVSEDRTTSIAVFMSSASDGVFASRRWRASASMGCLWADGSVPFGWPLAAGVFSILHLRRLFNEGSMAVSVGLALNIRKVARYRYKEWADRGYNS
ncbi:hypothetical protein H106_01718 [Trichophyton rubrum CBS 735.88]|nr:hypothetical protein H106_01718 [Trichophyton rubrum CBS 735.88]